MYLRVPAFSVPVCTCVQRTCVYLRSAYLCVPVCACVQRTCVYLCAPAFSVPVFTCVQCTCVYPCAPAFSVPVCTCQTRMRPLCRPVASSRSLAPPGWYRYQCRFVECGFVSALRDPNATDQTSSPASMVSGGWSRRRPSESRSLRLTLQHAQHCNTATPNTATPNTATRCNTPKRVRHHRLALLRRSHSVRKTSAV